MNQTSTVDRDNTAWDASCRRMVDELKDLAAQTEPTEPQPELARTWQDWAEREAGRINTPLAT